MLFDPTRHESLSAMEWSEASARAAIGQIVQDTESRFDAQRYWPMHPQDAQSEEDRQTISTSLYYGACGVFWGLHYLQDKGAAQLARNYRDATDLATLLQRRRTLG